MGKRNYLANHTLTLDERIKEANFSNFMVNIHNNNKCTKGLKVIKNKALSCAKCLCYPELMGSSIVIAGPVGRGKSHLGMSIAKYVDSHSKMNNTSFGVHVKCMFINLDDMFRLLKVHFNTNDYFESKLLHNISNANLVVLDGVNISTVDSKWKERFLKFILDARQGKNKIITTSNPVKKLKTLDIHVLSRLFENVGKVIKFPRYLPDMRMIESGLLPEDLL